MRSLHRLLAASALVVGSASLAQAQYLTDAGSPLGAGGGVTGALGIANAAYRVVSNALADATSGEGPAQVPNPAGGTASIRAADVEAIDAAFNGGGDASLLAQVFGGGTAAAALGEALVAFGNATTAANLTNLVAAYNAAIDALPPGGQPTAGVLLVRQALSVAGVPNWAR